MNWLVRLPIDIKGPTKFDVTLVEKVCSEDETKKKQYRTFIWHKSILPIHHRHNKTLATYHQDGGWRKCPLCHQNGRFDTVYKGMTTGGNK